MGLFSVPFKLYNAPNICLLGCHLTMILSASLDWSLNETENRDEINTALVIDEGKPGETWKTPRINIRFEGSF
jgi:hypothetical protein